MRVLVIGQGGQLADELLALPMDGTHRWIGATHAEVAIEDASSVAHLVERHRPDTIINTAAMNYVDTCEATPERAWLVNKQGPANLAAACAAHGIRLLQISTNYVFSGEKDSPYREMDETNPLSVYGKTMLAGEQAALATHRNCLILRTSALYGHYGTKSFVRAILHQAQEGLSLRVVHDQRITPTWTNPLARLFLELVERRDLVGVLHATGEGETTWHDFAREILRLAGISTPLFPIGSEGTRPPRQATAKRPVEYGSFTPSRAWPHAALARITGAFLPERALVHGSW